MEDVKLKDIRSMALMLGKNVVLTGRERLGEEDILRIKEMLKDAPSGNIRFYPSSAVEKDGEIYILGRKGRERFLMVLFDPNRPPGSRVYFEGKEEKIYDEGTTVGLKICPGNHENATALRRVFPSTAPRTLGIATAFGTGDRLGIATPGHIRVAVRCGVIPVLAQQSIREMSRTGRTPEGVLDDATWGAFQENYRGIFGADADHLKTEEDVRKTVSAGYTLFTIDPSDYVDERAESLSGEELESTYQGIFKDPAEGRTLLDRYSGRSFEIKVPGDEHNLSIRFDKEELKRTAVKYYRAILHSAKLYVLLKEMKGGEGFDLEMSVDETESPTSPQAHLFISSEMKRLGVRFHSLALRFVGEFQKAVDYRGDLREFEERLKDHVILARYFGPYKIGIHSGSDKFAIFPLFARIAGDLIHEKTAGTSWLEALRVVARYNPSLFREIVAFSFERFGEDRASYHLTTNIEKIPKPHSLPSERLPDYLDQDDSRQLLHVTYGSILRAKKPDGSLLFYDRIMDLLTEYEEEYYVVVGSHIEHHMRTLGMCKK